MVKKKAAKKSARKAPKKTHKRSAPKRKARAPKAAGSIEIVPQTTVDVTAAVKQDMIDVKPQTSAAPETTPEAQPVEKHEDFTQALTQEPPKKGFWARLFGKKE